VITSKTEQWFSPKQRKIWRKERQTGDGVLKCRMVGIVDKTLLAVLHYMQAGRTLEIAEETGSEKVCHLN